MHLQQMQQMHLQIPPKLSISQINAYSQGGASSAYSPAPATALPSLPSDTPGICRPKSFDDSLLNPTTPWGSRMRPSGHMTLERQSSLEQQSALAGGCYSEPDNTMAKMSGLQNHHTLAPPMGSAGMGAINSGQMAGRVMAQQMAMAPEQQRMRLVTGLVMQRLCIWGEYRTVCEWPSELVQHGAMSCIQEALLASPTHSLTIPQLVTAVKERTGNSHGGKALDMLNLKAYVRCFPALFHLRSGRTTTGRPLDVLELRVEDGHAMQHLAPAAARGYPQPSFSSYPQSSAGFDPSAVRHSYPSAASFDSIHDRGGDISTPPPASWVLNTPGGLAPSPASPTSALHACGLQPKELFGEPTSSQSSDGSSSPQSQPLWGSSNLGGFSLFAPSPAAGSGVVSEGTNAPAADELLPSEERGEVCALGLPSSPDDPPSMLPQIDQLWKAAPVADGRLDERATHPRGDEDPAEAARNAFMKAHALDKLLAQAVDRAMRYKVSTPVEFIAHELLRSIE